MAEYVRDEFGVVLWYLPTVDDEQLEGVEGFLLTVLSASPVKLAGLALEEPTGLGAKIPFFVLPSLANETSDRCSLCLKGSCKAL